MSGNSITDIQISTNATEVKQLQQQGFKEIIGYLDENNTISLWYKVDGARPITRIQFSFNESMSTALIDACFTKVKEFQKFTMWKMSGTTEYDFPITELKITNNFKDEISSYKGGWEQLGCDLNRFGNGAPIYIWVMREKTSFICNLEGSIEGIQENDLLKGGYICIDEDINRGVNPPGSAVFLFYRHSKEKENAITDIQVSMNAAEEKEYKAQEYIKLDYNLNAETLGTPVYLWYKYNGYKAIEKIFVLVGNKTRDEYQKAGCFCIQKNLNNGTNGTPLYIAYKT